MRKTVLTRMGPWQSSLLITSGLAALVVAASLLWQAGHAQWAFLLVFGATWLVIAISWSNVNYAEESGVILARIVDENFERMHERIQYLEAELESLRKITSNKDRTHRPWQEKKAPMESGR
jgi:hypothetical protein